MDNENENEHTYTISADLLAEILNHHLSLGTENPQQVCYFPRPNVMILSSMDRNVLLIKTELNSFENDIYFFDALKAFADLAHNPQCLLSSANPNRIIRGNNQTLCTEVGSWIPRSIFGYFRDMLYIVRSAYTAVWASIFCKQTIVFVDSSCIAIPILKYFGGFKVITFEMYRDLLTEKHAAPMHLSAEPRNWFHRTLLSLAEDILVPSCQARNSFYRSHGTGCPAPIVLYPPAPAEHWRPMQVDFPLPFSRELLDDECNMVFMAVGSFEINSVFAKTILAFRSFLNKINKPEHRVHLFVMGVVNWSNEIHVKHRKLIMKLIDHFNLSNYVTLLTNPGIEVRYYLYRKCFAVINVMYEDEFNWFVIEANYFKRPLIAFRHSFADEVIKNRVNGYLIPPNVSEIAELLLQIWTQPAHSATMMLTAEQNYEKMFSHEVYAKRLQHLFLKHTELDLEIFVIDALYAREVNE